MYLDVFEVVCRLIEWVGSDICSDVTVRDVGNGGGRLWACDDERSNYDVTLLVRE